MRPNASGWWSREGEAYVKINKQGLRDKEYKKNKIFLHGFSNSIMGEGHWNLTGHKIASQIISKKICESLVR